jgi:ABC-2 type transport system permease protein
VKSAAGAYLGLFRMRLIRGLSYRAAAIAGACTQFFWGFMLISVLQAFARSGGSPLDNRQIASYIWLQQAFLVLVVMWFRDSELIRLICSGDAVYELCRPIDLYAFWFARFIGGRLAAAALRSLPILVVAFFLPEPWRLRLPASPAAFGCFIAALALGMCVVVSISMFCYVLTILSLHPQIGFLFIVPVIELLSGLVLPLPFLPRVAREIAYALPFRFCVDLPFRIWSGSQSLESLPRLFLFELLWLAILVAGGRFALRAVLRRRGVPGG